LQGEAQRSEVFFGTPELNLYFAMICEAVQRVLFEARRPVRSPDWLEDFQWIYSDKWHPTSFRRLTSLLDIDGDWIRERIYDALSRGDPLEAPCLAQGRRRCRLAGLIVRDEDKGRRRVLARRRIAAA
jgi:hypothetical protein